MIRSRAAAAAFATVAFAFAGPVAAQSWGQPIYLNAYGRPVGGSPLSEVETRSYVQTGRWADGYSDRPHVYVPGPGYGQPYVSHTGGYGYSSGGYGTYGHNRRSASGHAYGSHGYRHDPYGHRASRYDPPSRAGYRDQWGYNDDRPPSGRRGRVDRTGSYSARDCGCADVYLYDR